MYSTLPDLVKKKVKYFSLIHFFPSQHEKRTLLLQNQACLLMQKILHDHYPINANIPEPFLFVVAFSFEISMNFSLITKKIPLHCQLNAIVKIYKKYICTSWNLECTECTILHKFNSKVQKEQSYFHY